MDHADHIAVPLRDKDGAVVAVAYVDAADALLAARRWHLSSTGYAVRTVGNGAYRTRQRLHREVLGLASDDPRQGDHINGDRLDNRRSNLRAVTAAENRQNQAPRRGSRSGVRGVSWDSERGAWIAHAKVDGRQRWLGRFATVEAAAAVVSAFRAAHMPFTNEERAAC